MVRPSISVVQDAVALPESELPLLLPETDNFKPSGGGESPLARVTDWVSTTHPSTGTPSCDDRQLMAGHDLPEVDASTCMCSCLRREPHCRP